ARAREGRDHALLLRGADAARDRRGAGRDGVADLAAPHEGGAPAEGPALGQRAALAGCRRPRLTAAAGAPAGPVGLDETPHPCRGGAEVCRKSPEGSATSP